MLVDLFIFDIAGTTVRDDGFVSRAFFAAARSVGYEPDAEWVRARMGVDKREVFRQMIALSGRNDLNVPALTEHFESHIEQDLNATPPAPLAGAEAAIRALEEAGVRLAFTTGFSRRTGESVLSRVGWERFTLVASDEVTRGRPAPDLNLEAMARTGVTTFKRVGVAGDTPSDLQAGQALGAGFVIGVGHGSHSLSELSSHPHTHLIPDLTSLPEILRGAV